MKYIKRCGYKNIYKMQFKNVQQRARDKREWIEKNQRGTWDVREGDGKKRVSQ